MNWQLKLIVILIIAVPVLLWPRAFWFEDGGRNDASDDADSFVDNGGDSSSDGDSGGGDCGSDCGEPPVLRPSALPVRALLRYNDPA